MNRPPWDVIKEAINEYRSVLKNTDEWYDYWCTVGEGDYVYDINIWWDEPGARPGYERPPLLAFYELYEEGGFTHVETQDWYSVPIPLLKAHAADLLRQLTEREREWDIM